MNFQRVSFECDFNCKVIKALKHSWIYHGFQKFYQLTIISTFDKWNMWFEYRVLTVLSSVVYKAFSSIAPDIFKNKTKRTQPQIAGILMCHVA